MKKETSMGITGSLPSEDSSTSAPASPFPYGSPQNPWRRTDGSVISCTEKLKVMQENMEELRQYALDALEDAVLMGCDEAQVKEAFQLIMASLNSGYAPAECSESTQENRK